MGLLLFGRVGPTEHTEGHHGYSAKRTVRPRSRRGCEQRAAGPPGVVGMESLGGLRCQGRRGPPPAFAGNEEHPVAPFGPHVFDIACQCFKDPQPVESEQGHQGVTPGAIHFGGDQ